MVHMAQAVPTGPSTVPGLMVLYIYIKKFFLLTSSLYLLVSLAWWDWPLTWLTNHRPSVL